MIDCKKRKTCNKIVGNPYDWQNPCPCGDYEKEIDKYRWHDLRKNPNDLPPTEHSVLVQEEFVHGFPIVVRAVYIHDEEMEVDGDEWETSSHYNEDDDLYYADTGWYEEIMNCGDFQYCSFDDSANVVAWREIEPFEVNE